MKKLKLETLNPEVLNLYSIAKSFEDEHFRKESSAEYYQDDILDFLSENYPDEYSEIADWESLDVMDKIMSDPSKSEIYSEFKDACYKKIHRASPTDGPMWVHMRFRKIIMNKWLVHFSNDAYSIHSHGFKYGVDIHELERLALSTNYTDKKRKMGAGYNFAYDVENTNLERTATDRRGIPKYGSEIIMFIGSGIKFKHYGDDEDQVVFLGKSAKNLVYIRQGDYSDKKWHETSNKTGNDKPLFSADDLDDVTSWVIKNYNQYKNVVSEQILNYKNFYKHLMIESTVDNIPEFFYHATYKPLLNRIKKLGLKMNMEKRYTDSKNVVYLSSDLEVAASYAETSEHLPDGWDDNIVIIKIRSSDLDTSKIFKDENVRSEEDSETFEYHDNIPPSSFAQILKY